MGVHVKRTGAIRRKRARTVAFPVSGIVFSTVFPIDLTNTDVGAWTPILWSVFGTAFAIGIATLDPAWTRLAALVRLPTRAGALVSRPPTDPALAAALGGLDELDAKARAAPAPEPLLSPGHRKRVRPAPIPPIHPRPDQITRALPTVIDAVQRRREAQKEIKAWLHVDLPAETHDEERDALAAKWNQPFPTQAERHQGDPFLGTDLERAIFDSIEDAITLQKQYRVSGDTWLPGVTIDWAGTTDTRLAMAGAGNLRERFRDDGVWPPYGALEYKAYLNRQIWRFREALEVLRND